MSPGFRHMVLGSFWFSVMSLLVKLAGRDLPAMEVVLFRGVLTLALSAAIVRHGRFAPWGTPETRWLLFLRGLIGSIALSCFYASVVYLPLAESSVIQYTNPIWTALLAAAILRERIGWREVVGVVAGLVGVVLIARPASLFGGVTRLDPAHLGIALFGAFCSASAYVAIRAIGRREHPQVVVLWLPMLTVPMSLPLALDDWRWPRGWQWPLLLAIGVTTQLGQLSLTRGLQREKAGRATAIGYVQIVFAAIWGALVFGERPGVWTLAGAAVILGSTLLVATMRRGPSAERRAGIELPEPAPADG
jgi:drug/metabolite transporter (DMT)-like permease